MKSNEIYPNVEEKVERWAYIELVLSIIIGVIAFVGGIGSSDIGYVIVGVYMAIQGYIVFTIMKLWIKTSVYAVRINTMLESIMKDKK
jgi:uncharacterized membrane protein HdeD (DUF308 family)